MTTAYRNLYCMGTRLEMVFPGLDEESADRIFLKINQKVSEDEGVLSIYNPSSFFSLLNQRAAEAPFQLSRDEYQLLNDLVKLSKDTFGFFDPGLGIFKEDVFGNQPPDLAGAPGLKFHEKLILNENKLTVMFSSPYVKLDSGSFGKGYSLNSIKKILSEAKIYNAFISFGDSSVLAMGKHPQGDCWKVGIRDLVTASKNAWIFEVRDGSVSTSGNTMENRSRQTRGHLIHPGKGKPIDRQGIICVEGTSPLITEVLSTALFVADNDSRKLILKNFPGYKAIEQLIIENGKQTTIRELN